MTTAQQDAATALPRDLSTAELQQAAQKAVRDYVAIHEREPTGEAIGRQFGMRERWGRNQIAAVREQASGTRAGTATARRHGTSGTASGTARPTVAEAVAARSGAPGSARAVFGPDPAAPAPARSAARSPAQPPAPPARTGGTSGTTTGTGAAQPLQGSGTAAARPSGTGRAAPAQATGTASADPGGLTGWLSAAVASGQLVAWLGFAFGAAVSVAANVKHAYIPRPPASLDLEAAKAWVPPEDWAPDMSAVLGAAVWPLMLLLAVEVMTRVAWGGGWWNLARFGGVGLVGVGSAWISYGHIRDVLVSWHYGDIAPYIGPLVVDGLMVISGFALLSISQGAHKKTEP